MVWVTPRAWASLELVTAGNMNTYISDLLTYLKGGAGTVQIDSPMTIQGNTAWHRGNDGAGSGLDADLLDGLNPSVAVTGNSIVVRTPEGYIDANFVNSTANVQNSPLYIAGQLGDNFMRWFNQGHQAGAGINADMVDGLHHEQLSMAQVNANGVCTAAFNFCPQTGTVFLPTLAQLNNVTQRRLSIKAWVGVSVTIAVQAGYACADLPLVLQPLDSITLVLWADNVNWMIV